MRPLVTASRVLTCLCIFPPDNLTSFLKKWTYIAFTFSVIASEIIGFVAAVTFVWKLYLIDFEKAIYAFCTCLGLLCMIYTALVAFFLRHKIPIIFERLTEIYETSKISFTID